MARKIYDDITPAMGENLPDGISYETPFNEVSSIITELISNAAPQHYKRRNYKELHEMSNNEEEVVGYDACKRHYRMECQLPNSLLIYWTNIVNGQASNVEERSASLRLHKISTISLYAFIAKSHNGITEDIYSSYDIVFKLGLKADSEDALKKQLKDKAYIHVRNKGESHFPNSFYISFSDKALAKTLTGLFMLLCLKTEATEQQEE